MKPLIFNNLPNDISKDIDLDYVSNYEHKRVIEKFVQVHPEYHNHSIEILFRELKKYLLICAITKKSIMPSKSIDKIWHEFILFTKDYSEFCQLAFKKYIHHEPTLGRPIEATSLEPFSTTITVLKDIFSDYNEHFWENKAAGDGNEHDENGCTHNDCGPWLTDNEDHPHPHSHN
jgi:hypothetical protein